MSSWVPANVRSGIEHLRDDVRETLDRWTRRWRKDGNGTVSVEGGDPWPLSLSRGIGPAIDVDEDDDRYYVTAELPGLDKKDFQVQVVANRLVIRGEKRTRREENRKGATYSECRFGSFSRAIDLPGEVQVDRVDAEYRKGILKVTLPKSESSKARLIRVEAN